MSMKSTLTLLSVLSSAAVMAQTIAAGGNHSVVICEGGGSAVSTGSNSGGQLGLGNFFSTSGGVTQAVLNVPSGIQAVDADDEHTFFLMDDGTVWACGRNGDGRLGIGTNSGTNVPVQVPGLSDVIAISAGRFHSLFLKSDGTVWAAGDNYYGALGTGDYVPSNVPVQVTGIDNIVAVSAGAYYSLFLRFDGDVWVCGYNGEGQLGTQNFTNSNTPVLMMTGSITAIAAGHSHSLMLKSDGTVVACGQNGGGQLGLGRVGAGTHTVLALGLTNVTKISGGWEHSVFLKEDGSVWSVGNNGSGQLGFESVNGYEVFPQQIPNFGDVTEIEAGDYHTICRKSDGSVWGFGRDDAGHLGTGTVGAGNQSMEPTEMGVNCMVTSIVEASVADQGLGIYPNPTATATTLSFGRQVRNGAISIVNSIGQQVLQRGQINGTHHLLECGTLASGLYTVSFSDARGTLSRRLVVQ